MISQNPAFMWAIRGSQLVQAPLLLAESYFWGPCVIWKGATEGLGLLTTISDRSVK